MPLVTKLVSLAWKSTFAKDANFGTHLFPSASAQRHPAATATPQIPGTAREKHFQPGLHPQGTATAHAGTTALKKH